MLMKVIRLNTLLSKSTFSELAGEGGELRLYFLLSWKGQVTFSSYLSQRLTKK